MTALKMLMNAAASLSVGIAVVAMASGSAPAAPHVGECVRVNNIPVVSYVQVCPPL